MFRRKHIRKILLLLVILPAIFFGSIWIYENILWKSVQEKSPADIYYDFLEDADAPGGRLVLELGIKDDTPVETILERVKIGMGLERYGVIAGYHGAEKPPAYIQNNNGLLTVYFSEMLQDKNEKINVTVHEMGHIYVWALKPRMGEKINEEKTVDCFGVYRGMGIQILNGLTEEFFNVPGTGFYSAKQRYFGYLKPGEFGYLLARYCRDKGIAPENVLPFLSDTGKGYFKEGLNMTRSSGVLSEKKSVKFIGIYWCPECGTMNEVIISDPLIEIKCKKCGWTRHVESFMSMVKRKIFEKISR